LEGLGQGPVGAARISSIAIRRASTNSAASNASFRRRSNVESSAGGASVWVDHGDDARSRRSRRFLLAGPRRSLHIAAVSSAAMGVVERAEYNFTLKAVYKLAKELNTSVSALLKGTL